MPATSQQDNPNNGIWGSQRNGLNHVSMNIGTFDGALGPARDVNYPIYSDALLDWYETNNVKSVRLLFTWEAVQSSLGGPVPAAETGYDDYWKDLAGDPESSVLARLLARDIYVILCPWQYNSALGDTDIVYDDAAITSAAFADFWGKFATAIKGLTASDQRVAFDLINEPHAQSDRPGDIGISLTDWFTCAQAAITAIRAAGATNTIFVPGMDWTAASSFTSNGSATEWLTLMDPQKNLAVTVHCYDGVGPDCYDGVDPACLTVLRDACSALVTWARMNSVTIHIGEIVLNAGSNDRPSYCSTFDTAQAQWADWNSFCIENNDVVVGWNWWANSAADWWNQGDSCEPDPGDGRHWGLTLNDGFTQTVYMDLIQSTLGVP